MIEPIAGRAVFAGCARNCGAHLPAVLKNYDAIGGLFTESAFFFVENDSTDSTKQILRDWCSGHPNARLIELDGLAQETPLWTFRMAKVRNRCVAEVAAEYSEYDYLFLLDLDDVSTDPIDLEAVTKAVGFLAADPARAGVFANQDGVYYDLWALRRNGWCPGDVWEAVLDEVTRTGVTDEAAYRKVFNPGLVRRIDPKAPPIKVASAFGGLGIYRVSSVIANPAPYGGYKTKRVRTPQGVREAGWLICEHVAFNEGFGALGQSLYILPWLINHRSPSVKAAMNGWFKPSAFRQYVFDPAQLAAAR